MSNSSLESHFKMRLVFLFIILSVACSLLPNVQSTYSHEPHHHHHGGHGHRSIASTLRKYLHGQTIDIVIDGVNEGILELIINSLGHRRHKHFLALLSVIPDKSDLAELLEGGEECKKSTRGRLSQVDALVILIKLAKVRCARERCKVPSELQTSDTTQGQDAHHDHSRSHQKNLLKNIKKLLRKLFKDLNKKIDKVLDEISSGVEKILKRLLGADRKLSILLGLLSKISKERDIKSLLGHKQKSSESKNELISRVEICKILIQIAKIKCSYGRCRRPEIDEDTSEDHSEGSGSNGKDTPDDGQQPRPPKKQIPEDDDEDFSERKHPKPTTRKPSIKGDEDDDDDDEGQKQDKGHPKPKLPKNDDDEEEDGEQSSNHRKTKPVKKRPTKDEDDDDDDDDSSDSKHSKPKPANGKHPKNDDDDDDDDNSEGNHSKHQPPKDTGDSKDESCSGKHPSKYHNSKCKKDEVENGSDRGKPKNPKQQKGDNDDEPDEDTQSNPEPPKGSQDEGDIESEDGEDHKKRRHPKDIDR